MSKNSPPIDFLWNVHSYLNEYIRQADTKAEFIVAWTSAILAALAAAGFQEKFALCRADGLFSMVGVVLLVLGFSSSLYVIYPRLNTAQKPGFIFWNSILGHSDKDAFLTQIKLQNEEQLGNHVAEHLHDLSGVARRKYFLISISCWASFLGSLTSGLVYILAK